MSKALVAYFSASGRTKALAERLAKAIGADLFEIEPETVYTEADLNWQDKKSRSSLEMSDRSSRPAIRSKELNLAEYCTVFVGFPVWWHREPSVIDTFMEAYDFSGKTVVPFATSGGGEIGDSGKNMQALAPGAKVEQGKRFAGRTDESELGKWASAWL